MKKINLLIISFFLLSSLFSQNYFKNYRDGESLYEKKDYQTAITEFSKVVEMKNDHYRAFNYRGLSYEAIGEFEKAVADLNKAIEYKPKEAEYHASLGRIYFKMEEYTKAVESLTIAINRDKKTIESYHYKIESYMKLKKYRDAADVAQEVIGREKTGENYYLKGVALDSLKEYEGAAYNFGRAIFYSPKIIEAHVGLAHSNLGLHKHDKALVSCDKALTLNSESIEALLVRVDVHIDKKDPGSALIDMSKVIALKPKEPSYYIKRGNIYQKINQFQNAVVDYTKAISINKEPLIYYQRAKAYEELAQPKLAVKDYEKIKELLPEDDDKPNELYKIAKKKLYELNKESNSPEVVMIDPISPKKGIIHLPIGVGRYIIKGRIKDESRITIIKVNGKEIFFNKDTINPFFEAELYLKEVEEISIAVVDAYENSETHIYKIIETEINPPEVNLMAPYASFDKIVVLDSDDPTLYIEGVIEDQSLITSILIEGATANFVLNDKNPKFSATINIMNKDDFTVIAEDQYGNKIEETFTINRENIELLANNPMGKTWVVFIENSDYKTFSSLDGPTKDVTMMKSVFAKYKIHNIVHKRNMTKNKLERFFSIELRDLVRSNKVNSLLVWYAGHGKFINETGYWIPTDAKRDDEFTYFNINNLKASMQSYSKGITHTLVVTDACESGPSFYQAMRSTPEERSCNDWKATKFKSSQVFSSAGYELAVDNSQFTKTFANTLASNPDACIPIETIVTKVKNVVGKGGKQKPKFGKIAGLEDENGTFFFIKK